MQIAMASKQMSEAMNLNNFAGSPLSLLSKPMSIFGVAPYRHPVCSSFFVKLELNCLAFVRENVRAIPMKELSEEREGKTSDLDDLLTC